MFTGIIQNLGQVVSTQVEKGSVRARIATGFYDLEPGESVAVNGACLTVESLERSEADFFISPETLARTNLAALKSGSRVNLERALTPQSRLSGHFVQGHVDGLGRWSGSRLAPDGESREIQVELENGQRRYLVEKGSVALNGVSLTINSIRDQGGKVEIGITLIPHTWAQTNLQDLREGDSINVEVDLLAKYVESLLGKSK
jgi:riboflavin synthase